MWSVYLCVEEVFGMMRMFLDFLFSPIYFKNFLKKFFIHVFSQYELNEHQCASRLGYEANKILRKSMFLN